MTSLELRQVDKRVRDGRASRMVLRGIDLTLAAGEIALVRGPSGAGKSTLLALAGLLEAPTAGEIWLDGEPTSRLRERVRAHARRFKIGFLFQHPTLLEDCSALDNVLYPAAPLGISAEHRARALTLLERFGVAALRDTQAARLSGGEQQRVSLARALLLQPRVLLCDEPTAHLDAAHNDTFVQLLAELAQTKDDPHAVLIATHDERLVTALPHARTLHLIPAETGCTLTEH